MRTNGGSLSLALSSSSRKNPSLSAFSFTFLKISLLMKTRNFLLFTLLLLFSSISSWAQSADYSKMSFLVAKEVQSANKVKALIQSGQKVERSYIMALVKLQNEGQEEALTSRGCTIFDNVGNIYIAVIPADALAELSLDERIVRIEANELKSVTLDSLPQSSNIIPIYQGKDLPQAYTGKGVVTGVIDIGFDFTHPMFHDANGHTRIKQVWDMFTGLGDGYKKIGSVYSSESDLKLMEGTTDQEAEYHGTHVAAIATGSPVLNGKYRGVAYDSDIVLSTMLLSDTPSDLSNLFYADVNKSIKEGTGDPIWQQVLGNSLRVFDAIEILAIKYIMDYAAEHKQPCVINCSFSAQEKLSEDLILANEIFSQLTGPGRIIVCSSGNDSDTDIYRMKPQGEVLDTPLWFNLAKISRTVKITLRSDKPFTFTLQPDIEGCPQVTVNTEEIPLTISDNNYSKYIDITSEANVYGIDNATKKQMENGDYAYEITIRVPDRDMNHYNTPSAQLKIEGEGVVQVMGTYALSGFTRFSLRPNNCPYTVGAPAAFNDAIAVGAMNYRDEITNLNKVEHYKTVYNNNGYNQIVSWSGTGPTLEGRTKPDIAASGYNVISALNSLMPESEYKDKDNYNKNIIETFKVGDKDYYMYAESGTSMATPVVTGTIALWLQANPSLTPQQVKEVFAKTAVHPDASLTYPNNMYGHGAIDAYKGLCYVLELATKIEDFPTSQPEGVIFSLSGKTLVMNGIAEAAVKVYSLSGALELETTTTDGKVNLSSLPSGVYAVKITTADSSTSGSTLVRIEK